MNRVAVHQPNYFPWIGYFAKLAAVDVFVFLDNVEFQSGNATSVTNRTTVKTSQGEQRITVPVRHGESTLLKDIRIDHAQGWKKKHLGTLTAAYGRAPSYKEIFPIVARTIEEAGETLAELNRASVTALAGFLGLSVPLLPASELGLASDDKNDRLIEICQRVGATTYLSGRGARRYNDEDRFRAHGITVEYTAFECPPYPQLHGPFVPNLSLLDALFNCGGDARRLLHSAHDHPGRAR